MIRVTVGNNVKREVVIVENTVTLRSVLEDNRVDYSRADPMLDGSTLEPGELDKTFAELGITDRCYLVCVENKNNA